MLVGILSTSLAACGAATTPRAKMATARADHTSSAPSRDVPAASVDHVLDTPPSPETSSILALAEATRSCPFDDARGFATECEPVERWEAETEPFENGKNDDALVWILEHGSPRARSLAASKLAAEGETYVEDPRLAKRLFDVAARESSEAVGAELGHCLAAIDLRSTDTETSALDLLRQRQNRALTARLLEELASHEAPSEVVERAIADATGDPRPEVRRGAVLGLATASSANACGAWSKALADTDPSVALAAAHLVATTGHCPSLLDATLSFIGSGQRKGAFRDPVAASILAEICERREATRAERVLSAGLAEGFADSALPTGLREEALRAALACDADEEKFVRGFTKDPDEWVRRMAKDLLKQHGNGARKKSRAK